MVISEWVTFEQFFERFELTEEAHIFNTPCEGTKKRDPLGRCRPVY